MEEETKDMPSMPEPAQGSPETEEPAPTEDTDVSGASEEADADAEVSSEETSEETAEEIQPVTPAQRREALKAQLASRRARSRRRGRIFYYSTIFTGLLVLGIFIPHQYLSYHYRDRYLKQPWIEIWEIYQRIDGHIELDIYHQRLRRRMDGKWLGNEAYFVGVYKGSDTTEEGNPELLVDVPIFQEALNFYEDDVHYELSPGESAEGLVKGDIIVGRGRVKNFSRYLIRLQGVEIRKAGPLEAYFYKPWTENLALEHEPIGIQRVLEDKYK
jgi:hypothetical protein